MAPVQHIEHAVGEHHRPTCTQVLHRRNSLVRGHAFGQKIGFIHARDSRDALPMLVSHVAKAFFIRARQCGLAVQQCHGKEAATLCSLRWRAANDMPWEDWRNGV
jgi:hypothetical protein